MGLFGRKKTPQDESRIGFIWSSNMQLRVAAPAGDGWQRIEATPKPPVAAAIKCVRGTPPDALALDAVVYLQSVSFAELTARDWRAFFEQTTFATVSTVELSEIKHATRSGFVDAAVDIVVEGKLGNPAMAARLRSRYVPSAEQLLVVTAMSSATVGEGDAKLIDSWICHASLAG